MTARAEDASLNVYQFTVELVGKVPDLDWLTQVVLIVPSNLPPDQTVLISVTQRGQTSKRPASESDEINILW